MNRTIYSIACMMIIIGFLCIPMITKANSETVSSASTNLAEESQFDRLFKENNTEELIFHGCVADYSTGTCSEISESEDLYIKFYKNHKYTANFSKGTWTSNKDYIIIKDEDKKHKYTIFENYYIAAYDDVDEEGGDYPMFGLVNFQKSQHIDTNDSKTQENNANAQFNLGLRYEFGEGVHQDYRQAAYWYRKAAKQGHTEAQFKAGWCYHYGKGVIYDYKEAKSFFTSAANKGSDKAKKMLRMAPYTQGKVNLRITNIKRTYNKYNNNTQVYITNTTQLPVCIKKVIVNRNYNAIIQGPQCLEYGNQGIFIVQGFLGKILEINLETDRGSYIFR